MQGFQRNSTSYSLTWRRCFPSTLYVYIWSYYPICEFSVIHSQQQAQPRSDIIPLGVSLHFKSEQQCKCLDGFMRDGFMKISCLMQDTASLRRYYLRSSSLSPRQSSTQRYSEKRYDYDTGLVVIVQIGLGPISPDNSAEKRFKICLEI